LINKSPFLLIWGYFSDKAWGFPQLFRDDKPSYFDTVSQLVYVMTEKGNLYKIDCEKRSYEQVLEKTQGQEAGVDLNSMSN